MTSQPVNYKIPAKFHYCKECGKRTQCPNICHECKKEIKTYPAYNSKGELVMVTIPED